MIGPFSDFGDLCAAVSSDIAPDPVKPGDVWRDADDEDDGGRE